MSEDVRSKIEQILQDSKHNVECEHGAVYVKKMELKQELLALMDRVRKDTIAECRGCLPELRPDAVKQGEIIPFDGKKKVEMHWLRKTQDAGFNQAITTAKEEMERL